MKDLILKSNTAVSRNDWRSMIMKQSVSKELYGYWNKLRAARAAPERSDLDPTEIRAILADTFLLDITGGRAFRSRDFLVRLSGTRLNALWCEDLKGRSLPSLWRPEDRAELSEVLDLVVDDQVPVVAGAVSISRHRVSTEFEMLLLPLRHHGKTHTRLFGSIVPNHPPVWLGRQPVGALALTSFRSIMGEFPEAPALPPTSVSRGGGAPVRNGRFLVYEGGR